MTGGLSLRDVTVAYGDTDVLHGIDLDVAPGETVGLVGESGSGKSTLALAALRALPPGGSVRRGRITLAGDDLLAMDAARLEALWRHRVRFVPQDPLPSMNPALPVGMQLAEALDPRRPRRADLGEVDAMLDAVGLPDPARVRRRYPFELSGGQQQRVMIAMALLGRPELLVMDEPTTNLDVTTEAAILELVHDRVRDGRTAVLYVSHSLGVVAALCDRVEVLYAGRGVERADVRDLYRAPVHPYTVGLLDAVPDLARGKAHAPLRPIPGRLPTPGETDGGCVFAPRCPVAEPACRSSEPPLAPVADRHDVACLRADAIREGALSPRQPAPAPTEAPPAEHGTSLHAAGLAASFAARARLVDRLRGRARPRLQALRGVNLHVPAGRTLGLVGESGSGKSTFARTVVGLETPDAGTVTLDRTALPARLRDRPRDLLARLQMVFQSSDEALHPYRTVGATLRRPLHRLAGVPPHELDAAVADLLASVALTPEYAGRTPPELSGGERQRVAIARAFASDPEVLLLDESVSGLDVSVQASVLNLLDDLQRARGASYLFIGHDLAVVAHLADEVAVLYLGAVAEAGPTDALLAPPFHPYTEALLAAVPRPDPDARAARAPLEGDLPSPQDVPAGCPFATRCPRVLGSVCHDETPPERWSDDGLHRIRCHIPRPDLAAAQADLDLRDAP